jgi:NAD(P)-dependent dehydrogenase (short-subunit alcohol dehydrogenase family)
MDFAGQTAIVTGGTGALGSVVTARLVALGARVAIPARSDEKGGKSNIMVVKTDLRNEEETGRFVGEVYDRFGSIEVVVNAAGGYAGGKRIEELSAADVMEMLELNALSAFHTCTKSLAFMKRSGYGRIVNIAAMTGLHPQSGAGAYAIAKRAVVTLTETLAIENRRTGITANAVAPGTIDTPANRKSMPGSNFSKWVSPEQVTDVILFLASRESAAVSGNVIELP